MTQQHSVTYSYIKDYPRPTPPLRRRGFRAWITRANSKARAQHERELGEWERCGGRHKVTVYIPHAQITMTPDPAPIKTTGLDGTKTFTIAALALTDDEAVTRDD